MGSLEATSSPESVHEKSPGRKVSATWWQKPRLERWWRSHDFWQSRPRSKGVRKTSCSRSTSQSCSSARLTNSCSRSDAWSCEGPATSRAPHGRMLRLYESTWMWKREGKPGE